MLQNYIPWCTSTLVGGGERPQRNERLLNAGANRKDGEFSGVIKEASDRRHQQRFKILLNAGANGKDGDPSSAIKEAYGAKHKRIVEILLDDSAKYCRDLSSSPSLAYVAAAYMRIAQ